MAGLNGCGCGAPPPPHADVPPVAATPPPAPLPQTPPVPPPSVSYYMRQPQMVNPVQTVSYQNPYYGYNPYAYPNPYPPGYGYAPAYVPTQPVMGNVPSYWYGAR
jgi:hypothetical protein